MTERYERGESSRPERASAPRRVGSAVPPRRWRLLALVALAVLAAGVSGSWWAGADEQRPVHAERLSVREVEVVFDPPQLPPGRKRLSDLKPEDLQVIDGGQVRPVVRLEPVAAAAASPWTFLLYFDLALARPETTFRSAIAVAERAPQLAKLGSVEVVVADPRPERLLTASRDAAEIQEVLAGVAARARLRLTAAPAAESSRVAPAVLQQQCDRLVSEVAAGVPVGPHALLLSADSPWLAPADMDRLSHAADPEGAAAAPAGAEAPSAATQPLGEALPAAAQGPGETLAATGRLLSAYGWLTIALPMRSLPGKREPEPVDEMVRTQSSQAELHGPAGANVVPGIIALIQKMRGKQPSIVPDMRLVAPQLDPAVAALVAFVRPTGGTVVPYRETLPVTFDYLAGLWHLWYQAETTPAGQARPLALKVPNRPQEMRAPRWVRASIPEGLAAARLRRLLAGDPLSGNLPVELTASPLSHGQILLLAKGAPAAGTPDSPATGANGANGAKTANEAQGASEASEGPLRVSFAWAQPGAGIRVQHQTLGSQALELWNRQHTVRVTLPAPPSDAASFAVVIEDLSTERWGGALVTLQPRPPGE